MTSHRGLNVGADSKIGSLSELGFVLSQARVRRGMAIAACLFTLLEVAATLYFPLLTRALIDRLGQSTLSGTAVLGDPLVQQLALVLIGAAIFAALSRYMIASVGQNVIAQLKSLLIERLVRLPVGYFDQTTSGDQASLIMNDTKALSQLVSREIIHLISGVLLLVGAAIILFSLDTGLASILFGVIGAAFLFSLPIIMTLAGVTHRVQRVTGELSSRLTQIFSEIRMVKAFGGESMESARGNRDVTILAKLAMRTARVESVLQPIMTLAVTFSMISILAYGGIRVSQESLTAGTLTAFLLYVFSIVGPLAQISSFVSQLASAKGASGRMAAVLRASPEVAVSYPAMTMLCKSPKPKDIRFEDVNFVYSGSDCPSLTIDRLTLEAGKKTAIIGPSGCGKSTLLALIERFYQPSTGQIYYGEDDIATLDLTNWRRRIGYVSQSTSMIAGSIRENVTYGLETEISDETLHNALRLARCSEFIDKLPAGVDTVLGENGVGLSGGQCQRIGLARIFMRNPEILLLDEATSQLDEANEHLVVDALRSLMHGRTSVFVTHRLSLVEKMDHIILLDSGHVVNTRVPDIYAEAHKSDHNFNGELL